MILNLLPSEYKIELTKKRLWREWRRAAVLVAIVTVMATAGLAVGQYRLQQSADRLQGEIDALQRQKADAPSEDITTVTTTLNTTIVGLTQAMANPRSWASDLSRIASLIPAGITIQSMAVTGSGSVQLEGTAATRQSFISLDDALQTSPFLQQVTTTSTPSKRDNLPFVYTALIQSDPQP